MNISWPHADSDDLLRLRCIEVLLRSRPQFLLLLFNKNEPCLRCSPEEILCSIGGLSHGEIVLIMLALDIWSGSGEANLSEVIRTLDEKCWSDFLSALSVFS